MHLVKLLGFIIGISVIIGAVKLYKEAEKIEKEIMSEQDEEGIEEDIEEDLSEETFFQGTAVEETTMNKTKIDEMDL